MHTFIIRTSILISLVASIYYNFAKAADCDIAWPHYKQLDEQVRELGTFDLSPYALQLRLDLVGAAYEAANCTNPPKESI